MPIEKLTPADPETRSLDRVAENIGRLNAGTESKLGAKKATPPDPNAASH